MCNGCSQLLRPLSLSVCRSAGHGRFMKLLLLPQKSGCLPTPPPNHQVCSENWIKLMLCLHGDFSPFPSLSCSAPARSVLSIECIASRRQSLGTHSHLFLLWGLHGNLLSSFYLASVFFTQTQFLRLTLALPIMALQKCCLDPQGSALFQIGSSRSRVS